MKSILKSLPTVNYLLLSKKEGLCLCSELKIQSKYGSEKSKFKKEVGTFCEAFGLQKIIAPSSKQKEKIKKLSKNSKHKNYSKKEDYSNNSKQKPYKRKFKKFEKYQPTCYKCQKKLLILQ